MVKQQRIGTDLMAQKTTDGRDELNLAEFPLCTLAHRLRPDQKTLQFEDRVWDDRHCASVPRQLTITGSDAYGLPTALDDEVLLGLIQLTKLRSFVDRKVPFTRYHLIRILGWRNDSKSYGRIEESLNRWTGVTLFYQNAWWNKTRQCWVNEKFHVLDNVWILHRSGRELPVADNEEGGPHSAFVWNEVLFRSFQAGNLKSIDFEFFKRLDSSIAKRLYRFLDKRFFHRRRWEFNLKELAWEHVGLARSYDTASLKRKLRPAIAELEQKGYLQPMSEAERFRRISAGEWAAAFAKSARRDTRTDIPTLAADGKKLAKALIERGLAATTARELIETYAAERITRQIEVFDWLMAQQDRKVSRNPPGFLVSAIKGEYAPPRSFVTHAERARREQESAEQHHQRETLRRKRQQMQQAQERDREKQMQAFWQSLSAEQRLQMESEAIAQAPKLQRRLIRNGGSGGNAAIKAALDAYVLRQLGTRPRTQSQES